MPGNLEEVRNAPHDRSIGIELECCMPTRVSWPLSCHKKFWYSSYDGSIYSNWSEYRATEFVSQPITQEWAHRAINNLKKLVGDWKYNRTCGIHIHINKNWFSDRKAQRVYTFIRTLTSDDRELFFGRNSNEYCRTVAPSLRDYDRYSAINITNTHTNEFRVYASGDDTWLRWCVDVSIYLVKNSRHLNVSAFQAFYDAWWAGKTRKCGESDAANPPAETLGQLLRTVIR